MKNFLKPSKSIGNKIALSIFIIIVLIIGTVSFFRFRSFFKRFQESAQREAVLSVKLAITEAEKWFESNLKKVEHASLEFKSLSNFISFDKIDKSYINHKYGNGLYIGFENQSVWTASTLNIPVETNISYNPTVRPWYQLVKKNQRPSFIDPYRDAFLNELTVTFGAPLHNNKNQFKGVVAYDVLLKDLLKLLSKTFSSNINNISHIQHLDHTFILIEGEKTPFNNSFSIDFPIFSNISNSPYKKTINGKEYLFVFDHIKKAKLFFVFPISLESLYAPIKSRSLLFFGINVIALLGATLIIWLLIIHFTRPLKMLSESAKKIAKGNFNIELPKMKEDEVGELTKSFNLMVKGLKERDLVKNYFGKFVGASLVSDILKQEKLELGGKLAHVSILFCDIKNFTGLAESISPEKTIFILNHYFSAMVNVVHEHNGFLDKYLGDGFLAIFGNPIPKENHADLACLSAIKMFKQLDQVNIELQKQNYPKIGMGIGIHSGQAIVGNIGASERMEYSIIGDAVNTASRTQTLTRQVERDILVTQETVDLTKETFEFDEIGCFPVKGKIAQICVHALNPNNDKHA